jgi:hypothetical protein
MVRGAVRWSAGPGIRSAVAAWRVEERGADQLLMCNFSGRPRSCFMVTLLR